MFKHHNKTRPGSPAHILMRGHHANGGEAMPMAPDMKVSGNPSNHYSGGGNIGAPSKYKKGGHCRYRAEGGEMESSEKPETQGANTAMRRGGKAHRHHHADGDKVEMAFGKAAERKRGGHCASHHDLGGVARPQDFKSKGGLSEFHHKPSTTRIQRAMGGVGKERKNYPDT